MADWMMIVVLVVAGLVLIAVDFYLPGFVLGSIGAVMILFAVWVAYRDYGRTAGLIGFLLAALLAVGSAYTSIHYFPKTATGKKMILGHTQEGMRSQDVTAARLVGRRGTAQTNLRPTGMASLEGKRVEVMAESGLIERGSSIEVVAIKDNRVVVRKLT